MATRRRRSARGQGRYTAHQTALWSSKLQALAAYRSHFGDCRVPRDFVVPTDASWPQDIERFRLGDFVNTMRFGPTTISSERIDHLRELGFQWQLTRTAGGPCQQLQLPTSTQHHAKIRALHMSWDILVQALVHYHASNGHCRIPNDFYVKHGSAEWPRDTWGLLLAPIVPSLRYHFYELDTDVAETVHALGLLLDMPPWETLLLLFRKYRTQFGRGSIPIDFCVPTTTSDSANAIWPRRWRGIALGELAWTVGIKLAALSDAQVFALNTIGYRFNAPGTWRNVLAGIQVFAALRQTTHIDKSFVVPEHSQWPETLWGLRLGYCSTSALAFVRDD
ncbi:hypothetical protein ACHHYP_14962 [Achlya hypogyna]|uniref:Helicase-associated domain-containing protein n=1 Tax=Achlya hypogyna TaxID=1202772 RepID=A0A1V9YBZ6_ACHHY|nr:hypothetical protein ACHHYP_14962 [Achlya hypogyna]